VPSATHDAANRQIAFGGQTLTFDLNGNLTSDGNTTYTWDMRDRLASLAATGITATYQYDPLGRRARKTLNGTTTTFHYDGHNLVQELSGAAELASMLSGLEMDEHLTRMDSAGTHGLLVDALGGTVALTTSDAVLETQYTYEPFGVTVVTDPTSTNPFQYTGRENDGTSLYYYRARYYHPRLARFISEDPSGPAGAHLYLYVDNSPTGFIDPWGLDKERRTCTGIARFSAIGPLQARGVGALGVHPGSGTVAISPAIFGLPFPEPAPGQRLALEQLRQREQTQRILGQIADRIIIQPQGLRLHGGPVPPYTVSDIGDLNIRRSPIPRFDIYRFPTLPAARQFGIQDVQTTITIPTSLTCPPGFTELR
jgi:RHS repeat-associated protein